MEIVSFEIAKKLKEKGFPQHITDYAYIVDNYGEDECDIGDRLPISLIPDYMDDVAAPTIWQVLKWLREEKKWSIVIRLYGKNGWYWFVQDNNGELRASQLASCDECFSTYEQAALAGIEYVIDNLI